MNSPAPKKQFRVYASCADCRHYRNLNDVNGVDVEIANQSRRRTDDQSPDRCIHPSLIGGDYHVHSVAADWARCDSQAGLDRCGPHAALFEAATEYNNSPSLKSVLIGVFAVFILAIIGAVVL